MQRKCQQNRYNIDLGTNLYMLSLIKCQCLVKTAQTTQAIEHLSFYSSFNKKQDLNW